MTLQKRKKLFLKIALFCFLAFLFLSKIIFTNEINTIDKNIYEGIIALKNDCLTLCMKIITSLSSSFVILPLTFLLLFFFKEKKQKAGIICNVGGIVFLNQILKRILKRNRPNICPLLAASGYSFPSGHAMVSVAFYGFLTLLLSKKVSSKKVKHFLVIGTISLIILIGFSRIYLGVHYASDVLAGYLCAICYLYLFNKAYQTFSLKKNCIKLIYSFKYAFTGILSAFKTERNMKIHVSIMCLVILFGVVLKISTLEWMICIFCFALVIGSEMMNTAIEKIVDIAMPEKNEKAKLAKDIAAGSVLVCAIASLLIGLLLFLPKLFAIL